MKIQVASQSGSSDLAASKVVALAETREENYDESNDDNTALNNTGPVLSSALDVPELPLLKATTDHGFTGESSIRIKKTFKQLPCKGVCIGNLCHLSADAFGINPVCKKDIDLCPQFVGRLNRGPKVPCYVVIRNNEEYLPSVEIEYIDKLILMWQAVDMDDFHIKSSGLKVLVNKNVFTDTKFNFVLFSS